jgi:hypothetical protein
MVLPPRGHASAGGLGGRGGGGGIAGWASLLGLERDSVPSLGAPLPGAPQGCSVWSLAGWLQAAAGGPSSYPPVAGRCG